ncbi:MAG TPA: biotin--[acetyl-CoA-carboxylase] ligase [Methylomirabilota bacterium]|nr:biotin--[acetyl-CoA-carboxylase] ligase [Methylomirabilota bacterium]
MIATDSLSIEAIRRRLTAETVGGHLYVFGEVESTNTVMRHLARSGAEEGAVVLAESQSQGRGRLGQPWFSPAGVNLYASVLFRPGFPPREAPRFAFIASLALADAVREQGLHPGIKWPNDVLVGRKKAAGSLMECATRGDEVEYLVLGVGVNLNVDLTALQEALGEAARAATSLAAVAGREIDRSAFAASYLNALDDWARRYRKEGPAPILAAWRQRDILTGRRVEVRGNGTAYDGRALGVDDDGRLIVQDAHGARHVVLTEEIRTLD